MFKEIAEQYYEEAKAIREDLHRHPELSYKEVRTAELIEKKLAEYGVDSMERMFDTGVVALIHGAKGPGKCIGIRADIDKGDITYSDIISVFPFGNSLCVLEVTGQEILDALEWSVRYLPGETGSFLQVSGLSFEVDMSVESPCVADDNNMFLSVEGERRVKNVMAGDEPIDPEGTYTLAGHNYMLEEIAEGYTMFKDAPMLQDKVKLDNQMLIDYIRDDLGGEISKEYADPYGQGRIVILQPDA